jgi:hypothetical protein
MKEKLKNHFMNIGPKRFVLLAVLLLIITDLINSYYLKLYWMQKKISSSIISISLQRSQLRMEDFSSETLIEMMSFVDNAFYFFILIIILNNLFFYAFYLKKKLWAQGYVLFYCLTAAIFSLTFVFDNEGMGQAWLVYNLLTIPFYIYLYFGVKLLKVETTLVPGKKGQ